MKRTLPTENRGTSTENKRTSPLPLQEITVEPGHVIIGHVQKGQVHIADIVHGGILEMALTGQRPDLLLVPVEVIEAIRKKHGLLDPIEDDVTEDDVTEVTEE